MGKETNAGLTFSRRQPGSFYLFITPSKESATEASANYSFDSCGGLCDINRVFGMADEVAFFKAMDGTNSFTGFLHSCDGEKRQGCISVNLIILPYLLIIHKSVHRKAYTTRCCQA